MNKRWLVSIIAALLILALPACASASGLGGLGELGGGLSNLLDTSPAEKDVVPDPESLLGKGSVLQRDYLFSAGYTCTAYTYPLPENAESFIASYTKQGQTNGLAVETTAVEGYDALKLTDSTNKYALLVMNFNGSTLLLVQNGMTFGQAKPEGYYAEVTRNGRLMSTIGNGNGLEGKETTSFGPHFEIYSSFVRSEITFFLIGIPNYAKEGDDFYVTRGNLIENLSFYTEQEGFLVDGDYEKNALESSTDYFHVYISSMTVTGDGLVIEGEFDGSFYRGKTTYTDGFFRALIPD